MGSVKQREKMHKWGEKERCREMERERVGLIINGLKRWKRGYL